MLEVRELFDSMAASMSLSSEDRARGVDALNDCEEAVTACASAMLTMTDQADVQMAVRRDLDCADVVHATRRLLTRGSGPDSSLLGVQLEACLLACEQSNELCAAHASHHEYCRICSEATRRCATVCRDLLNALRS
ncbi:MULTISPECIES: hypothetical protein [Protofrankia]|uniref:Four-helix bundle copper-binding protein n=1 Tax=Candidatus Protofrankia datiscae TaxID=2716812 RepID=F8AVY7_9ACTN|nr:MULTISPECIES: hypothetical protein [Protofrankia]AEH09308.1 hypothetical protein FsymDg_1868 [Candidatus Protofrankia datiscae]